MRFASLNGGSNGANYAAAGRAVADSSANIFNVQRKTGPDYAGLSKQAMKSATEEKVAGMKAEAKVTSVGLSTVGDVASKKLQIEGLTKSADIKRNSRKAGALGAIGSVIGAGYLASKDNTKGRERPKSDLQGLLDKHKTTMQGIKDRHASERDELGDPEFTKFEPTGVKPGKVTGGSTSGTSSSGTADPSDIRTQAFNYLTKDKGLSRNKALGIIANVDRESGWNPSIRSGDDGGPGGLFQWKGSRQTSTVAGLVNKGDWKGQLDYALSEPGEAYSQTYQQTTFDSPQQAADAWMTHWERPADTRAGSSKHTNFLGGYSF